MFPNGDGGAVVDGVAKLRQRHVQFVHLRELFTRLPLALNTRFLFLTGALRVAYGGKKGIIYTVESIHTVFLDIGLGYQTASITQTVPNVSFNVP